MHREQYGEYGYWCRGVFRTWFSFMHLCFRKALSVTKEESSKAKKSRRAISLDSGKEIMSTYWGYFFTWKVMWKLSSWELWLCLFCINIFLIFIGWTVLLTGLKEWKYRFGLIFFFGFIYLWNMIVLNFMWMWKHFGYFSWWIRWPNIFIWLGSTQGF